VAEQDMGQLLLRDGPGEEIDVAGGTAPLKLT
jgi:hypothetical protein